MGTVEIWKDSASMEDYEVSSFGNVRMIGSEKNRTLPTNKRGYVVKGGRRDKTGKRKYHYVHRLVAEAFLPNPNNLPCVNHKNCIKTDNRVDNLEWCSYKHNNSHARENIHFKGVGRLVVDTETGVYYDSVVDAYKAYNFDFTKKHLVTMLWGGGCRNKTSLRYA